MIIETLLSFDSYCLKKFKMYTYTAYICVKYSSMGGGETQARNKTKT